MRFITYRHWVEHIGYTCNLVSSHLGGWDCSASLLHSDYEFLYTHLMSTGASQKILSRQSLYKIQLAAIYIYDIYAYPNVMLPTFIAPENKLEQRVTRHVCYHILFINRNIFMIKSILQIITSNKSNNNI